jgi:diguanylate cyclase
MVRPILGELAAETGLEALYLTRIHWRDHEQEILAAANLEPTRLFIPEQVKIDYSDAVCRYVIEGSAPDHTDNVPLVFAQSDLARFMRFQSFISAPVDLPGGEIFGTLCGASTSRVTLTPEQVASVRRQARRIAGWLAASKSTQPV